MQNDSYNSIYDVELNEAPSLTIQNYYAEISKVENSKKSSLNKSGNSIGINSNINLIKFLSNSKFQYYNSFNLLEFPSEYLIFPFHYFW